MTDEELEQLRRSRWLAGLGVADVRAHIETRRKRVRGQIGNPFDRTWRDATPEVSKDLEITMSDGLVYSFAQAEAEAIALILATDIPVG